MRLIPDPRRLLVAAVVVAVVLNMLSLVTRLADLSWSVPDPLVRLVSVDIERNLPSSYNAALLALSAVALCAIAVAAHRAGTRWWAHWALLAAVFAYLTVDEAVKIHEAGIAIVEQYVERSGALTFGWVLLAAPLVLVFAVVNVPFLRWLPPRTALLVLAAGTVFVTGALGLEMVSGLAAEGRVVERPYETDPVLYVLASQVEELLEMVGVSLFLYALATYAPSDAGRRTGGHDAVLAA